MHCVEEAGVDRRGTAGARVGPGRSGAPRPTRFGRTGVPEEARLAAMRRARRYLSRHCATGEKQPARRAPGGRAAMRRESCVATRCQSAGPTSGCLSNRERL